jgi:hypothetical protein
MNTVTETTDSTHPLLPDAPVGLPIDDIMSLSEHARCLYNQIFDYCTYAADPQYHTLHKFRLAIAKLDHGDRDVLITYFNADPAIQWTGMPCEPYAYYATPYDAT